MTITIDEMNALLAAKDALATCEGSVVVAREKYLALFAALVIPTPTGDDSDLIAIGTTHIFPNSATPAPAHQHPLGGGWVADTAQVAATAYVGPNALVYGAARVYGNARVSGDAQVCDNARVSGNARVSK